MRTKLVLAVLALSMLAALLVPSVSAVSETTTGLTTNGFDRNTQKHVTVGSYDIYAFDNELVFYTANAQLAKTWVIPFTGSGSISKISVAMAALNESYILVAASYCAVTTAKTNNLDYFVVNVDSLATTTYSHAALTSEIAAITSKDGDLVLYQIGINYYVFFGSKVTGTYTNYAWVTKIYPTYQSLTTKTDGNYLFGSSFAFQNTAETDAWVLTRSNVTGSRFTLYSVSAGGVITSCGTTGTDDTCGVYWNYYGGYVEHTVGSSTYTDVLVGFGFNDGQDNLKVELLRFNATYFDVVASNSLSSEMYGSFPRVIGLPSTSLTSFDALTEGSYNAIYLNNVGALYYVSFSLTDLDTYSPTLGGSGLYTYQGLVFLFGGSANAGALIDGFSTVALMVDYTGGRCAAETVTPISSTVTYTWTITPTPTYEDHGNNFVQLAASSTYLYTATVAVNGVNGAGSVTIADADDPTNQVTKTITNGQFTFNLYTSTISQEFYYNINVSLTNFVITYQTYLQVVTLSGAPGGTTPTTGPFPTWNPGLTPGTGGLDGASINYNLNVFVNFIILFLCVGAPALLLGVMAGAPGFIGGAILGLGVGTLAGLLPFWFIFLVGLAVVVMIMFWRNKAGDSGGGGSG